MKITHIETVALRDAENGYDETVVRVHTDEGAVGIGQAESPSLVIDAVIKNSEGLEGLLVGQNPTQVTRLWQKMYDATGLYGRRGVTIAAIGAVETALWDLAGQALGVPVHELIWRGFTSTRAQSEPLTRVTPYVTVYPSGSDIDQLRERMGHAAALGFRAVKMEEGAGMFGNVDLETDVRCVEAARDVLGPARELLVDVQNMYSEYGQALASIRAIEPFRPFLVEAPFPPDNLEAYARLADTVDVRIGVGDWGFTTRHEFRDIIERGRVDVVQPSTVRSGGISEIMYIAEMAYQRGLLCIPHAWCHLVGAVVGAHLAAVTPNMPFFETPLAYPASPVVSDLLEPKPEVATDGTLEVPRKPGLGFTLNEDVVRDYRVDPY